MRLQWPRKDNQNASRKRPLRRSVFSAMRCLGFVFCGIPLLYGMVNLCIWHLREVQRREQTELLQERMRGIHQSFLAYGADHGSKYPPLAPYPGVWAPDFSLLFPAYLSDLSLIIDPTLESAPALQRELSEVENGGHKDFERMARIFSRSYVYPGFTVQTSDNVDTLIHMRGMQNPKDNRGTFFGVYELGEGVERHFIANNTHATSSFEAQSTIPVLFQTVQASNIERSIHTLYMDGHMAVLPIGSAFPAFPWVLRKFAMDR